MNQSSTSFNLKRIVLGLAGFVVVLIGVALIVLPGPGWLIIWVGMTILAGQFTWARNLLRRMKENAKEMKDSFLKN